jgi:hypothetical protein
MLDARLRDHADWSIFVDKFGGWMYDKEAGHSDHDPVDVGDDRFDSPNGTWLGMLLVPEDFANAAVKMFPTQCEIIDEAKAECFYEVRCAAHQPAVHEDVEVLQAMAAKKALGQLDAEGEEFVTAMDADHPSRGRRVNKMKTWAGMKEKRGVTIKASLAKDAQA